MSLDVKDIYQIATNLVSQATGRSDLTVTNDADLVNVGEIAMRTAYDPLLNAIGQVIGKTIFSARPYDAKFSNLRADSERWGNITRKISYIDTGYEQSSDWNTTDNPNWLSDDKSVDMYKIKKAKPVQFNFTGSKVLQKHITMFRDQLSLAFHNANEMESFLSGVMTNFRNEIEQGNEALARAVICNFIAGVYNMAATIGGSEQVVHLLTEFNAKNGTKYTKEDINKAEVAEPFLKFMSAKVAIVRDMLTERSILYHCNVADKEIARHTPKRMQRLYAYNPFQLEAMTNVFPTVFNTEYLGIGDYEKVNYWQSIKSPESINITGKELDENGNAKLGEAFNSTNVVAVLTDRDALGYCPQFDYSSTTPFNSAGGYSNLYMHYRQNWWNDFTENGVVFLLD